MRTIQRASFKSNDHHGLPSAGILEIEATRFYSQLPVSKEHADKINRSLEQFGRLVVDEALAGARR